MNDQDLEEPLLSFTEDDDAENPTEKTSGLRRALMTPRDEVEQLMGQSYDRDKIAHALKIHYVASRMKKMASKQRRALDRLIGKE